MSTERQVAANRANSKRSTGPRTPDGKARSSKNNLKHGLRSESVVIPTEDRAEFDAFLRAWIDDWQPRTMARLQFVERAAVAAWRSRRCVRLETGRISERIGLAQAARAARDRAEVRALERSLATDPLGALAGLRKTALGLDFLIAAWTALEDLALSPSTWNDPALHDRLVALQGFPEGHAVAEGLRRASLGVLLRNEAGPAAPDGPRPFGDADAREACAAIRCFASGRVAQLARARDDLPDDSAARVREVELDALQLRPEDVVHARYEAQQDRIFRASIDALIRLAKAGADLAPDEPNPVGPPSPEVVAGPGPSVAPDEANFAGRRGPGVDSPNEADPDPAGLAQVVTGSGPIVAPDEANLAGRRGSEVAAPDEANPDSAELAKVVAGSVAIVAPDEANSGGARDDVKGVVAVAPNEANLAGVGPPGVNLP